MNEQNRRYHQQISSRAAVGVLSPTTSDSTKSTPAKNAEKLIDMSTTCSSASSTSSTKGSSSDERNLNRVRQPQPGQSQLQGNGVVTKSSWTTDMEANPSTTSMMTSAGLRDTKIEIAGRRFIITTIILLKRAPWSRSPERRNLCPV